jgi:hypothetical protein
MICTRLIATLSFLHGYRKRRLRTELTPEVERVQTAMGLSSFSSIPHSKEILIKHGRLEGIYEMPQLPSGFKA